METNTNEIYRLKGGLDRTLSIDLPLSKSLSARSIVISKMASCRAPKQLSDCDDTQALFHALADDVPYCIDIGAAGTAMRFSTAYLATCSGSTHMLTGSKRMLCRPIKPLVDALRQLGADIKYAEKEGFPPLIISGRELEGGCIEIDGSVSSQFISALLMIAPCMKRGLEIELVGTIMSRPYIDMTLGQIRQYGARAEWITDSHISVAALGYHSAQYSIEADWSAASYWYEAVALAQNPDIEVELRGLHQVSLQGDRRVEQLFEAFGVETRYKQSEPQSVIIRYVGSKSTARIETSLADCPDLAQTLIVTAVMLNRPFCFSGIESLAIKETDRQAALQAELRKMGARVEIENGQRMAFDGLSSPLHSARIQTYSDHRMAMAFAPTSLIVGQIEIECPQVVSKSYPMFWRDQALAGTQISSL